MVKVHINSIANLSAGTAAAVEYFKRTKIERFEHKFTKDPVSGCWLWIGVPDINGYGVYTVNYQQEHAHRWSYRFYIGDFDGALHVLHKCDTPICVNPDHLFLGTQTDNNKDMWGKGRGSNQNVGTTHCKRGHEFTEDNTRRWRDKRICRACANERQAHYRRQRSK